VTGVAVALAVAAGLAGAVQAAVMGELGDRVGVFPAIAFSGIVVVVLSLACLLVVKRSFSSIGDVLHEPAWLWIGGVLSVLIVLAITVAPPHIGVTATIGIIIALNLGVATVIDRFGLFGYDRIAIGWTRVVGVILLAAGAALSLHKGG
jgi:transporter family-2 protein